VGYCGYGFLYHVVINPTLPVILFSYANYYNSVDYNAIGVVIGNTAQYIGNASSGSSATIVSYHTPIVFFENSILILPIYNPNGSSATSWAYTSPVLVCNLQVNTCNFTEYLLPQSLSSSDLFAGWLDAYLDFQNGQLYLLGVNYNMFIVLLFAIPFNELSTLLNQLQFPQNFNEASLMPTNGASILPFNDTYPSFCLNYDQYTAPVMIYYNEQFYLFFQAGELSLYMWTFSLDQIIWSSTFPTATTQTISGGTYNYVPSNLQSIGSLYNIMYEAGYENIVLYGFAVGFNYYINSNVIYPEILLSVILWNYNSPEGWTLAVISIDPGTLNTTNIANLVYTQINPSTYVYPVLPIYLSGGLIITEAYAYSSYYYIFVYDRNTGDTALFPPPANTILVVPAEGGYVISVTGSSTDATITIYQVVADAVPVITNVEFANNTISGTAVDLVSNTPVANATVALFQLISQGGYEFSGAIVSTTTTDSNGDFSFQVSQQGYYGIRAFT